jgi:hypothetical protein
MRNVLRATFLLFAIAHARPDFLADFVEPLPELPAQDNDTLADAESLELVKRQQNNCATGYAACLNLGAPGLCCRTNQVCSRDGNNNVACCPTNSACTGTIIPVGPVPTAFPSTTGSFALVSTTTSAQPAPSQSFVQSETASQGPSMVPNSFYPFPPIPTTHINAAACSSAYTSCSQNAQSCTSALANGLPGVTISGPNGGATITAIASLGIQSASSICASLSSQACSGLIVEACARYGDGTGNAAKTLCGNMYGLGAGVAVGLAGQLLR